MSNQMKGGSSSGGRGDHPSGEQPERLTRRTSGVPPNYAPDDESAYSRSFQCPRSSEIRKNMSLNDGDDRTADVSRVSRGRRSRPRRRQSRGDQTTSTSFSSTLDGSGSITTFGDDDRRRGDEVVRNVSEATITQQDRVREGRPSRTQDDGSRRTIVEVTSRRRGVDPARGVKAEQEEKPREERRREKSVPRRTWGRWSQNQDERKDADEAGENQEQSTTGRSTGANSRNIPDEEFHRMYMALSVPPWLAGFVGADGRFGGRDPTSMSSEQRAMQRTIRVGPNGDPNSNLWPVADTFATDYEEVIKRLLDDHHGRYADIDRWPLKIVNEKPYMQEYSQSKKKYLERMLRGIGSRLRIISRASCPTVYHGSGWSNAVVPDRYEGKADYVSFERWVAGVARYMGILKLAGPEFEVARLWRLEELLKGRALTWFLQRATPRSGEAIPYSFLQVMLMLYKMYVHPTITRQVRTKYKSVQFDPATGVDGVFTAMCQWIDLLPLPPGEADVNKRFVDKMPTYIKDKLRKRGLNLDIAPLMVLRAAALDCETTQRNWEWAVCQKKVHWQESGQEEAEAVSSQSGFRRSQRLRY